FLFFIPSRRRQTRSKRDWSSDVCSSDLPFAAIGELFDGRPCRLDVPGHTHGLVVAQMVLLRTELGVGDVSARGVQTFDPGRGDGFRAQQQRVDPPPRRIVDLRRHGGDEPGGFQGVLPYLALEQCTYVLLGEPRGQIVREGAASSRRRRRTPEVRRLMPLQPCALDAHCPSSIKFTDLRLIHGRREARLMTSLLPGWALSTAPRHRPTTC